MLLFTVLEVVQAIPGQSILDKSILGIFSLVFMGAIAFIYKQMIDSQKAQTEQHKQQMEVMIKKLDESERDRDDIYNNYLDHFKTSEQSLLQIISKNTDAFAALNQTAIKLMLVIENKLK